MKRIIASSLFFIMAVMSMNAQTLIENHSILFKKDSVNVDETQMAHLEMMAEYFKAHPKELYFIGGFTSKDTPAERIDYICEQRANAVRQVLANKFGVDCSYIFAIGVGVSTKSEMTEFNEKVEFFKK